MKYILVLLVIVAMAFSCKTPQGQVASSNESQTASNDTVRISSDKVEYEIIIIEPGFNTWLVTTARPEGYYSQSFLENRNIQYVTAWNQRVMQANIYDPNLYEMQINYQQGIDYGYDVNYKLYNYFIYFQLKYKEQLTGYVPRI